MTSVWGALLVLAVLMGSSVAGLYIRPLLAEHHRSGATLDLVRLVNTMLVTFAALVLGLLTTSVKSAFDTVGTDLRGLGSGLIQLDQSLREYGPGAERARALLQAYTAAAIASTWPSEAPPAGDFYPRELPRMRTDSRLESQALGGMLRQAEVEIRSYSPPDAFHQRLASDCLTQLARLIYRRWKLIEEAHPSISVPFYVVLVFWMTIVFASFGLSAPRNLLVVTMLALGAVSISSAIFVILDLDQPFNGLFGISSAPLRATLAHLLE